VDAGWRARGGRAQASLSGRRAAGHAYRADTAAAHAGSDGRCNLVEHPDHFAVSVNVYTLPLGLFGGARPAFAVCMLVASYGAAQALISPAIGAVMDARGYAPVCMVAAVMPLAAYAVLRGLRGFLA